MAVAEPPALRLPATIVQHVHARAQAMAEALAREVAELLAAAVRERGCASLLLSGGRSPVAFFERLSACPLDWAHIAVGLVDERWVAADADDSNERLVRAHLLRGPAALARFVALMGGESTPEAGIDAATQRLATLQRPFDVVVLGMGTDGHTASWFADAPETAAAMSPRCAASVAAVHPRAAAHARMTLTLPVLLDARRLLLAVQGADKRAVLERAAAGADPAVLPVAAILQQTRVPLHVHFSP